MERLSTVTCTRVGLARTIYMGCVCGIFGREITKYTVIYGVHIYGSGQPYTRKMGYKGVRGLEGWGGWGGTREMGHIVHKIRLGITHCAPSNTEVADEVRMMLSASGSVSGQVGQVSGQMELISFTHVCLCVCLPIGLLQYLAGI